MGPGAQGLQDSQFQGQAGMSLQGGAPVPVVITDLGPLAIREQVTS